MIHAVGNLILKVPSAQVIMGGSIVVAADLSVADLSVAVVPVVVTVVPVVVTVVPVVVIKA
jgi:hypothetical protein